MSSQALEASSNEPAVESVGHMRYVARQPILDLRGRVHGYELLYRAGDETAFRGDFEIASRTILDNTVIFGVEKFTGGSLAFVNCTSETLTEDLVSVLSPEKTVLEILETAEPSSELIAACVRLKALGFKLALDDFIWAPKFAPLVQLADYIKVDFLTTGPNERRELIRQLKGEKLALVAEKIETQQEYEKACAEGFTLFQGYYFCRPQLMANRKVPSNHLCHFEILRLLQTDPIDLNELSHAVKRDESLTYRLLRMVNSAANAMSTEIHSVQSALVLLGEVTFRRVALLAIATELNSGRPPEILKIAMIRARFCELAATLCELSSSEQYLLGMLSLLSAMLSIPMEDLTPALPLRKEIREALEGAVNPESCMLEWLKGHEQGNWAACEAIVRSTGLEPKQLNACYQDAVLWAESQFHLVR